MNIERTVEFLLSQQAKIAEQQYKTDRRVDAIAKLLQTGMKMLVRVEKAQTAFAEAQRRNEERLAKIEERLVRSDERFQKFEERLARSDEKFEKLMAALLRKRTDGRH